MATTTTTTMTAATTATTREDESSPAEAYAADFLAIRSRNVGDDRYRRVASHLPNRCTPCVFGRRDVLLVREPPSARHWPTWAELWIMHAINLRRTHASAPWVIPLAVPFYRPIPGIQLSNSFHAAKYHSVISRRPPLRHDELGI